MGGNNVQIAKSTEEQEKMKYFKRKVPLIWLLYHKNVKNGNTIKNYRE